MKQNGKLKEKVRALSRENESASMALRKVESEESRDSAIPVVSSFNNIQYIEMMKHVQQTNEKYIRQQNEFSKIKNRVGVYVLGMLEALPD